MKLVHILRIGIMGCLMAAALALPGCVAASEQVSTDEHAAEHRAYMAQLGNQAKEIDAVLNQFQSAVGAKDVVAMRAATAKAGDIVAAVATTEAPEKLAETKDSYVAGLEQLQQALEAYTQLYADVEAAVVNENDFSVRLAEVQSAYDAGVEAVKAADDKAVELSKE